MKSRARSAKASPNPEMSGRDILLWAASELMIERRTTDVSLHQIAKRAGVTAPLVKYHFGSKDGLLVALAERDTERSLSQLGELMDMDFDPATKLRYHITGIIRTYARYPYLNRLLDTLLAEDDSKGAQSIRESFVEPLIMAQRQIIRDGIAQGQFRPIDPNLAYFHIVGACQYIFSTRVAYRLLIAEREVDDAFARGYADFIADTILNGIIATER